VRDSDKLMLKIKQIATKSVNKCVDRNTMDWGKIKNTIKEDLSEFLWREIKRSPLIMPIVMEYNRQ